MVNGLYETAPEWWVRGGGECHWRQFSDVLYVFHGASYGTESLATVRLPRLPSALELCHDPPRKTKTKGQELNCVWISC